MSMSSSVEVAKQKAGRWLRRFAWVMLVLGILVALGYYFTRTYTYSDGNRAGILVKVSKKGVVFKTYEGQLHLGNSMQMNEQSIWNFSARDEAVYRKLQQFEGKNVSCHYRELVGAFPWQGETNYIVDDVIAVQ
jgi:hypothetical protein